MTLGARVASLITAPLDDVAPEAEQLAVRGRQVLERRDTFPRPSHLILAVRFTGRRLNGQPIALERERADDVLSHRVRADGALWPVGDLLIRDLVAAPEPGVVVVDRVRFGGRRLITGVHDAASRRRELERMTGSIE